MMDWNIVATTRPQGFRRAHTILSRFGPTRSTEFRGVLVTHVDDITRFTEDFVRTVKEEPDILGAIARVVPVSQTFFFQTPEEFDMKVRGVLVDWLNYFVGRRFHVRIHRRGFKGKISSLTEEQALDRLILDELEKRGDHARIAFDDVDVILDIEIVGQRAGMSLWNRDQINRYSFLHLDA